MSTRIKLSWWYRAVICLVFSLFLIGCCDKSYFSHNYNTLLKGSYNGKSYYTIKRGDTLYYIAWITHNEVRDLAKINKIPASYHLTVGQKLRLSSRVTSKLEINQHKNISPDTPLVNLSSIGASRHWLWPTNGKVVRNYSSADGGNKGIDIAGVRGQPIYTTAKGKVVYVGNQLRGYGNLIMIKHGEDFITAYAHNDTIVVHNGQNVKAGEKIATMGSSGTHSVFLHFQIRYRTTTLDPQNYLPPRGS